MPITDAALAEARYPGEEFDICWDQFGKTLESLINTSERLAHVRRSSPANIPHGRNRAWKAAAQIYQVATGRPPSVPERSDGSGPYGPFVDFISAFTVTIPGQKKPTHHEIRGWFRAHWKT